MNPNPALKKLGFAETDRVAIIHTDDIGMSHASYAAFTDLWQAGIISSAATMVPCPWFPKVAAYCRSNAGVDMGVHLTLTSEWAGFRWGPISTRDKATGLIDDEGYFFRDCAGLWAGCTEEAVAKEIQAQIDTAIAAGITPTHIDSHMGSVLFNPALTPLYVKAALQNKLPVMVPRRNAEKLKIVGAGAEMIAYAEQLVHTFDEMGAVMVDEENGMPLNKPEQRLEQVFAAIDALKPGLTHFIIHPSHDTPEARAISPDLPSRIGDYETFMDERVRQHIKNAGVHVIGYRDLKALLS